MLRTTRRSCPFINHISKVITESLLLVRILLMRVRISHRATTLLIGTTKSSLIHTIIPGVRTSLASVSSSFMR